MPRYRRYKRPSQRQLVLQPRMNERIRAEEVRLLDELGNNVGVMSLQEALKVAREKGFDVIEMSAKAVPPVVKMGLRGKFLYELAKKGRKAKKLQPNEESKSIRLRPGTSAHDVTMKAEQIDNFIKKGYKVEIELQLRGREKALEQTALAKLQGFIDQIQETHHVLQEIKKTPRGFHVIVGR